MQITLSNFGGFHAVTLPIADMTAANGAGKTTLLNGFIWTLTGRTLGGFEPRRKGTPTDSPTEAILTGFADLPTIRRTTGAKGGTTLYIAGDVATQVDFTAALAARGIDIDFLFTCADANALTSDALTSDDLRKLLTRADVMDNGEAAKLRKEKTDVAKKKKTAEQYALSNVTIPARTCKMPSEVEIAFVERYNEAKLIVERGTSKFCKYCNQELPLDVREAQNKAYNDARNILEKGGAEFTRIDNEISEYEAETRAIDDAQRLINNAVRARDDVKRYDDRLKAIDEELRELDANAVRAELPDGVTLITEQTSATGNTKSVCTLEWNGVPLKSVNRAKRIEICVRILSRAREAKGMQDTVPIWIDNAEAVQGLHDVPNVIRLTVG